MFWTAPKCPLDDDSRQWVDESFRWFVEELSPEVVRSVPVVLPEEHFFPDPYDGSRRSIRKMVDRVCEYMDVDPELIEVRFFEGESTGRIHPLASPESGESHPLGIYRMKPSGKYTISLNMDQAGNPEMMVATIAHELGHVILLGEGRLDEDFEGHEPLTDLLTVAYGFGVFSANSSFVFEQWTNAQFQGWRAGGAGYLTEEAYGYALALFAHFRSERKPAWSKYLKTNVKAYFKRSARYLEKNPPNLSFDISPEVADRKSSRTIDRV